MGSEEVWWCGRVMIGWEGAGHDGTGGRRLWSYWKVRYGGEAMLSHGTWRIWWKEIERVREEWTLRLCGGGESTFGRGVDNVRLSVAIQHITFMERY